MNPIQTNVVKCPRCGMPHDQMTFMRFSGDVGFFTHFGSCCNTQEPILLRVLTEKDTNDYERQDPRISSE
jgi:hypothetical protein